MAYINYGQFWNQIDGHSFTLEMTDRFLESYFLFVFSFFAGNSSFLAPKSIDFPRQLVDEVLRESAPAGRIPLPRNTFNSISSMSATVS